MSDTSWSNLYVAGPASGMTMNFDDQGNQVWTKWHEVEAGGEVESETWTQYRKHPVPAHDCRTYWGSHGCELERGHDGPHECDCCDCENHPDPDSGCVATHPYYGPNTSFYGEDTANG